MNQQEEQIKELFQQLRRDDERHTPPFAGVWAVVERGAPTSWGWPAWRVALATIVLLMLAGVWAVSFRQPADERFARPPAPPESAVPRVPEGVAPPSGLASSTGKPPKLVRRRRVPAPPLPLDALVSQWRSPTDFLLRTPGEQWLKEVPRLGVPRAEIKPLVIEQKNELEEL